MRKPSLLIQFSTLSLVLFIVIGAVLGMYLTHHFEQEALEQQKIATSALMQPAVSPYLNKDILATGAYGKDYQNIEYAFSFLGGAGLVRVKIWNPDGLVVYSDDPALVGTKYEISSELKESLEGQTTANISGLSKEENVAERGYGELMEVYAPLRLLNDGDIVGAFEGYYDIDELRQRMNATNTYLWTSIAGGFLFLYLSLFAIVRGASQRLITQSHENALLLADTQRKAARLQAVNELARSINVSSLDLERVFQTALHGIDRIMQHNGASISLLDERTGATVRRLLSPATPHGDVSLAKLSAGTEKGLLGDNEVVIVPDTGRADSTDVRLLANLGIRSFLAVSIGLGERKLGVLMVTSDHKDAFDEDNAETLAGVADQLAVAIENMRLIREIAETTALRETNRLKDEFVSMVSHELRTPLASIKGYAQTLLAQDADWDESTRNEFLTIIVDESDKLTDLVENVLEMSRIGAGRLPITPEPVLLSRFCKNVVDRIAKHYPSIEFDCDLDDPLPVVEADPRRVEQVLANLLQNAAKYSGSNCIRISGTYDGGADVMIGVHDSGKGIPPEHVPYLFEKFYRGDQGSSGKGGGTGLGLAIARALIEAQGGRIWVDSTPGKGASFYFTLPALILHGEGGQIPAPRIATEQPTPA